jgi:flavin reductase (DIM6/NTAB) family NADH-FMN oxidoreductase RutF
MPLNGYRDVSPNELENAFHLIGERWMLVTAKKPDGTHNSMTASWGGLGVLWSAPVAFVFVRPQRHTFGFAEASDRLALSFYGEDKKDALGRIYGARSGRDTDKDALAGFTPVALPSGAVSYREASLILDCRKLYADDLREECFAVAAPLANYPAKDFHRMYVCAIENCYSRE